MQHLRLASYCHGAHNREQHEDEDVTQNNSLQYQTRQGRHTGTLRVTNRPDNIN